MDSAFTAYRKLIMVRWAGERVDVYANKIRQLAGLAGFEGAGLERFPKLAFVTGFPNAISIEPWENCFQCSEIGHWPGTVRETKQGTRHQHQPSPPLRCECGAPSSKHLC